MTGTICATPECKSMHGEHENFEVQWNLDYPEQSGQVFQIPNFPVNQTIAHFDQKSIPMFYNFFFLLQ